MIYVRGVTSNGVDARGRLSFAGKATAISDIVKAAIFRWRVTNIGRHLTRHESRHKLARTVFHGRRGQLRQPYREGMEDQPGALGLVVNVMVLWTTLYNMDRALGQLRGQGAMINDEDVARLAPLGTNHINVLGRYQFSLPEAIARGEFRPLRDPTQFDDEDPLIQQAADDDF